EFIYVMQRTSLLINNGWKLNKQKIEQLFTPNLIIDLRNIKDIKDKICPICLSENKFALSLYCCNKMICFDCSLKHVDARYNNSVIECPYCRGDLFGWYTNFQQKKEEQVDEDDDEES